MGRREKLPEILAAHARWLDTDGREGARANLQRVNLEGADLAGARLQNANLRHTRLGGTNFTGADLRGADLRGAQFSVTTQGYNELDLPREYATADFTGAQLTGVIADVPLGGQPPTKAAKVEVEEPEPDDSSATWVIPWPDLARLETLVRRAGGVVDPQLLEVSALIKVFDDQNERVWQRTNGSCAISIRSTTVDGAENWRAKAATRFGHVALSVARRGSETHAPLVVEIQGTPKEAAVLGELLEALR